MSKVLKKLIDINRLKEFKNKLVGAGSAYVQTTDVDQTVAGTKTFSKPIVGSVTGNAATATKLATARTISLTGAVIGSTAFNGSANASINTTLSNIDASKITSGTIDLARIPKAAIPELKIVANDTARFALTTSDIQNGDTVQVTSTGKMYYVKDQTKLSSEAGYAVYTAGTASSVPWSGVTGKPSSYTPAAHTQAASTITGLATVATSGSYKDLTNKPTIPTVNNATLTIQKNGTTVKTFTANASANVTANITVPTKVSELTNDSGFLTNHQSLSNYVTLNGAQTISGAKTFTGNIIGINKERSTEDANSLYSITAGSKLTYYTTSNGGTTLTNVPAAVNTTLESRTIRRLSDSDWIVEQICHNSNGLYYRKGGNGTWGAWKTFAFTDSNISGNAATATTAKACTGNAATATRATQDSDGNKITTTYSKNGHTHDNRYYTETEVNKLLGGKANTSGTYSNLTVGNAGSATNATYANWLRTSSHTDHLFHTEWDNAGYFWTYVTAGDGGYRAVRVARSDSSGYADTATKATQDSDGNKITTTYSKNGHTHDNRYYTETEVNNLLGGKANDSGVVHKSGNETIAGTKTFNNNVHATGFHATTNNALMAQSGGYTLVLRNDGSNTYLLMSDKGGAPGTFNGARPLVISNSTGVCDINGNAATATTAKACTGNAATATRAAQDSDGNRINATYVKKTDMQNLNTGACFIGFYSSVSHINGVGNGGRLTVGYTTSASNIYDTIIADTSTVTCSKNITLVGVWKLVSIIRNAVIDNKNYIGVEATHSPGSSYQANVLATQGLFVRVS